MDWIAGKSKRGARSCSRWPGSTGASVPRPRIWRAAGAHGWGSAGRVFTRRGARFSPRRRGGGGPRARRAWPQGRRPGARIPHEPRIVFLDEPTGGVDALSRREFWRLIDHLAGSGVTVLVTTHYLHEAERSNRD